MTGGGQQYFPATGWIWFEVQEFAAPTLFSALSDLCEPVRAIMGDFRRPYPVLVMYAGQYVALAWTATQ